MKKWMLLLLCMSVFSFSAFAEDWNEYRGDAVHSGHSGYILQPPLALKWAFTAGDKIVSSPVIKNGKLFFGARDNFVYTLNASSGTLLWKFQTQGWVDATPYVSESALYVSSRDGFVYALNSEDGALLWKHETGGKDSASLTVAEGFVLGASGYPNKFLYALNAETGEEVWTFETVQSNYSSPSVVGDTVYVGSGDGNLYALNLQDGTQKWAFKSQGNFEYVAPAIEESVLYFAAGKFDWTLNAVNANNGSLKWTYQFEDIDVTPNYVSSVALSEDLVFVVAGYVRQFLYAIAKSNGTYQWKVPLSASTRMGFSSSPIVSGNTVYVATAQGMLKAIDIPTGSLIWEFSLGSEVVSSPAITNDGLFVGSLDGKIRLFN